MQKRSPVSDTGVLLTAIPAQDVATKLLSKQEFRLWKLFYDRWKRTSQPISAEETEQLVREVFPGCKNWSSPPYRLEQKGVLTVSEGKNFKFRTPVTSGIVIMTGREGHLTQLWPELKTPPAATGRKRLKLVSPPGAAKSADGVVAKNDQPAATAPHIVSKETLQQQLRSKQDALREGLQRTKEERIATKATELETHAMELRALEEQIAALQTQLEEKQARHEVIRDEAAETRLRECTPEEAGLEDVVAEIADLECAIRVYDKIVQ